MSNSVFEQIQESAKYLGLDFCSQEMAQFAIDRQMSDESIQTIADTFSYLKEKKSESIVSTLLRLSRLPLKEPKTFEGFDFNQLHGKQVATLNEYFALATPPVRF